jgi:hypothetical protein
VTQWFGNGFGQKRIDFEHRRLFVRGVDGRVRDAESNGGHERDRRSNQPCFECMTKLSDVGRAFRPPVAGPEGPAYMGHYRLVGT